MNSRENVEHIRGSIFQSPPTPKPREQLCRCDLSSARHTSKYIQIYFINRHMCASVS